MVAVDNQHSAKANRHVPVLLAPTIEQLRLEVGMTVVDATIGNAGHAQVIAVKIGPAGTLIGLDADQLAIEESRQILDLIDTARRPHIQLFNSNFAHLHTVVQPIAQQVDAIVIDLGLRRGLMEDSGRGFSFQRPDEPLDMRFDPNDSNLPTAAEVLQVLDEGALADLFYHLADERRARQYAAAIVAARRNGPIATVGDLVAIIQSVTAGNYHRRHPATKVFQALRMTVNRELDVLALVIKQAVGLLRPGGRLAIITFHSVEDRAVKQQFKQLSQEKVVKIDPKKPIKPSRQEITINRQSRSALLRVITKL